MKHNSYLLCKIVQILMLNRLGIRLCTFCGIDYETIIELERSDEMPILPKPEDYLDLRKSKYRNKGRQFSVGNIIELDEMDLPQRASVLTYSLTPAQQKEFDEQLDIFDALKKKLVDPLSPKSGYTAYLAEKSKLIINGKIIDCSNNIRTKTLLSVLFANKDYLTDGIGYGDLLSENSEELSDGDINKLDDIRFTKANILKRKGAEDLFPFKASLKLNAKYLENLIV
jgi:hypothetical protein